MSLSLLVIIEVVGSIFCFKVVLCSIVYFVFCFFILVYFVKSYIRLIKIAKDKKNYNYAYDFNYNAIDFLYGNLKKDKIFSNVGNIVFFAIMNICLHFFVWFSFYIQYKFFYSTIYSNASNSVFSHLSQASFVSIVAFVSNLPLFILAITKAWKEKVDHGIKSGLIVIFIFSALIQLVNFLLSDEATMLLFNVANESGIFSNKSGHFEIISPFLSSASLLGKSWSGYVQYNEKNMVVYAKPIFRFGGDIILCPANIKFNEYHDVKYIRYESSFCLSLKSDDVMRVPNKSEIIGYSAYKHHIK